MTVFTGNEEVFGYCNKKYTLNDLRNLCPPKDKWDEYARSYEKEKAKYYDIFNNLDENSLPNEDWKKLTQNGWTKYSVSTLGRVMIEYNDKNYILKLKNEKSKDGSEHQGYLIFDDQYASEKGLSVGNNTHIWNLIAMGFLGRPASYPRGKALHVHHIDNNGYNCKPENLILLTPEQHSYVHGFSCEYQDKSEENYHEN